MIEIVLSIFKSETVFAAVLGMVVSIIAALISQRYKKLSDLHSRAMKEELRSKVAELSLDLGVIKVSKTFESQPEQVRESSQALMERMEQQILERVSALPKLSNEQIKEEVRNEILEFKTRIEKIEKRFPAEAQLEKISSINDAILSERIDQLSKKIENLENKSLSRWDVAITVSTIIGGIFAVVASTYAVINFITTNAQ